jgi:peptide chain release factor 2
MLSDEGDTLSAVVQITAGGGTESCDWAEMLMHVHDVGRKIRLQNQRTEFPERRSCRYKTVTLEFEAIILWLLKR